jgi:hypothetical protein
LGALVLGVLGNSVIIVKKDINVINRVTISELAESISLKTNQLKVLALLAQEARINQYLEEDIESLFSLFHEISIQISSLTTSIEIETNR